MELDGDKVKVDGTIGMDEIEAFEAFIRPRLDYIETIEIEGDGMIKNSALLLLLISVKRTKSSIKIPLLEKGSTISSYHGILHWICHD